MAPKDFSYDREVCMSSANCIPEVWFQSTLLVISIATITVNPNNQLNVVPIYQVLIEIESVFVIS